MEYLKIAVIGLLVMGLLTLIPMWICKDGPFEFLRKKKEIDAEEKQ